MVAIGLKPTTIVPWSLASVTCVTGHYLDFYPDLYPQCYRLLLCMYIVVFLLVCKTVYSTVYFRCLSGCFVSTKPLEVHAVLE